MLYHEAGGFCKIKSVPKMSQLKSTDGLVRHHVLTLEIDTPNTPKQVSDTEIRIQRKCFD